MAAIGAAWLKHYGFGAILPWILGTWLFAALPMMYVDVSLVLDMIGYVFTGKVHFFPTLIAFWSSKNFDEQ